MDLRAQIINAYKAFQAGDYTGAENRITNILTAYPRQKDTLALGAMISRKLFHFDAGLKRIRAALAQDPLNHEYLNTHGNLLADTDQVSEAVKSFKNAIKHAPSYMPAYENLAFLLLKSGQAGVAQDYFELIGKSGAATTKHILGLAQCYKDTLDYKSAIDVMERLPLEDRYSAEYLVLRAQILFLTNDFTKAIEVNRLALTEKIQHPLAFANIAQIYQMNDEAAKIDALIEEVMALPGPELSVFSKMVSTCLSQKKFMLAERLCDTYEQKNGRPDQLSDIRAQIHFRQKDYDQAIEFSKNALSTNKHNMSALSVLAQSSICTNDHETARTAITTAETMVPDNQYWIAMRAMLNRSSGKPYRDIYDYDKFVRAFQVYGDDEDSELEDLKTYLNSIHQFKNEPIDQSLRQGTQTTEDLGIVDHPLIRKFWKKLDGSINAYLDQIGRANTHPFSKRNTGDYRIAGAWSVRLRGEGFHVNHVHPQGWISGAFYVEVPPTDDQDETKSGWIKFGEPSFASQSLPPEHHIRPAPGKLVLFPSYMWHGTVPTLPGTKRMTISFDLVPD